MNSSAQDKSSHSILLSGYSFSAAKSDIGAISFSDPGVSVKKFSVKGDRSKSFRITADNHLMIKEEVRDKGPMWFDVVIQAQTSTGNLLDTFRIVRDEFLRNKVIAHRGAWKNTGATENSLASLKHAIDMGCEGSEFDVHMSADSVLFIHHDPNIDSILIEKTPAAQLAEIKLSNGERLPLLEDYIKAGIQQNKTRLILEIKPSVVSKERAIALTHKVTRLVRSLKAQAWVDYISFDYEVCKELKKIAPYARVSYLKGDKSPEELRANQFYGLDYNQQVLQKQENWIKDAREKNLTVNVWTVNDPLLMDWFLEKQVDFITTNEPETLLKKVGLRK
jgi:glycerophosphoryl diester phosphodiesterase